MNRTPLSAPDAPKAIGPYSQAIAFGDLLFLSGQIPLDPATGDLIQGDVTAQTRRVLENIKALLAAGNSSFDRVLKSTVFLTDLGQFAAMNAVYAEYFSSEPPAQSTIQVAALPKGAQVEIEVIAARRTD